MEINKAKVKKKYPKGIFAIGNKLYIYLRHPITKKTIKQSTGFDDTPDGIRKAKDLKIEIDYRKRKLGLQNNLLPLTKAIKLSQGYLQYTVIRNQNSKNTKAILQTAYNQLLEICGDNFIANYTDYHFSLLVKYWIDKKSYSQNSQSIYSRSLIALFNYFVDKGYIKSNPVIKVKELIKPPKDIPKDALDLMFEYLKKNNIDAYHFLYFLYLTGFRKNEAVDLKWSDVDFRNRTIIFYNKKSKYNDTFPIHKLLYSFLLDLQNYKKDDYVFIYRDKKLQFFYRMQDHLFGENRYTIHQFRKTFTTMLLRSGVTVADVKDLARHKNISTTMTYYNASLNSDEMAKVIDDKVKF